MKKSAVIQFVVEDYILDTSDLTLAQHGAYLRSMMFYYRKGAALTVQEMKMACGREHNRIIAFYIRHDGHWHHKRIDSDLKKSREKSEMYRIKSEKMRAGKMEKYG